MIAAIAGYGRTLPRRVLEKRTLRAGGLAVPAGWERSRVAGADEDALTLALAAAAACGPVGDVRSLALASTALPYAQRVQSGLVAEALALDGVYATEHTTSARAGTEALLAHAWRCAATGEQALVLAAEPGPARPDELVRSAGAAAVRLAPTGGCAELLLARHALHEDPGLRFVLTGQRLVRDIEVADYAAEVCKRAVADAVKPVLAEADLAPADLRAVVLAGVPAQLAAKTAAALGLERTQWEHVWPPGLAGDLGAASALFGLCVALDAATPGDHILVVSYGSGSAADALLFRAGEEAGRGGALPAADGLDLAGFLRLTGGL